MGKMPMPRFLGNRPPAVWLFFVAVGLTSLVKGPLIGAVEAGAAVATFLALTRDWGRILRYVWLWGWLLFVAVTSAWYLYAYHVYPSIWDNFRYDLAGSGRSEPFWYYAAAIGWTTSPLTPLWIVGLVLTWRGARADRAGPNRFLWCWWLAPLIVLSLPARKHHHYLVPVLGAFAVLAGVGMDRIGAWIGSAKPRRGLVPLGLFAVALPGAAAIALLGWWQKIPGPLWATLLLAAVFFACAIAVSVGLSGRSGRWVLAGLLAGLTVFAAWGQSVLATSGRNRNLDIYFLARVRQVAAPDIPLLIDTRGPADMGGSLEFFRQQFYLPAGTVPLQNLTFLRDQRISADKVYVLTRYRCRSLLSAFGSWRIIEESGQKATAGPSDHYALFLLTFAPGLERYPAPPISVMQALGQAAGPTCGPPLPPGEGETPAP
jgi:4-amino-4-deoxy-L-arabinose transferase-like glycosyltransferase